MALDAPHLAKTTRAPAPTARTFASRAATRPALPGSTRRPTVRAWPCGRDGRDQGTGDRPVRGAVPRGRLLGAGLRLPRAGKSGGRGRLCAWRSSRTASAQRSGLGRSRAWRRHRVSPGLGGQAAARNALRHQRGAALPRLIVRGVVDAIGGLAGREPLLVPLVGERGEGRGAHETGRAQRPGGAATRRPGGSRRSRRRTRAARRGRAPPRRPLRRSWAGTSGLSRPSWRSCAGTCSPDRHAARAPYP